MKLGANRQRILHTTDNDLKGQCSKKRENQRKITLLPPKQSTFSITVQFICSSFVDIENIRM